MKVPAFATVTTICGAAILFTLGTWQVQRLQWKQDIIERLDAGFTQGAKGDELSEETLNAWSMEESPVGYGKVTGRPLRMQSILLGGRIHKGRSGYHLLIPVELDTGRILIINAGWVDPMWADNPSDRFAMLPAQSVTAIGAIHKPDWSAFASQNSPANDIWFRADIAEIAAKKKLDFPYPFILYADSVLPEPDGVLRPEERWLPRNKHLQYALFWYALGVALIAVYGFYFAQLNKKRS